MPELRGESAAAYIDSLAWYPHPMVQAEMENFPALIANAPPSVQKLLTGLHEGDDPELMAKSRIAKVDLGQGFELSIICSPRFYSNGIDTFETAIRHPNGDIKEIRGHQSADDVVETIARKMRS